MVHHQPVAEHRRFLGFDQLAVPEYLERLEREYGLDGTAT
jgi:hypothetical protein